MISGDKKIKSALIKTTNSIKAKYKQLHKKKQLNQENLKEFYKPVIESINDLRSGSIPSILNKNHGVQENKSRFDIISSTPKTRKSVLFCKEDSFESDQDSNYKYDDDDNENGNDKNNDGMSALTDDISQVPENMTLDLTNFNSPHVKRYLSKISHSNSPKFDSIYGIQKNGNDYKIGNTSVKFDGDGDIIIRNKKYEYSKGLYDLLFYAKPPPGYSKADLAQYKRILDDTNAHKKNYQSGNSIRANNSFKYSKIIKSLYKQGTGLNDYLKLDTSSTNYTYWDDPNELVNRLRLLISSKTAGHTGHENEIISIIEELREAKLIV